MAVPEAAVSFLLENLSQVLVRNYHLATDLRENIVKLQRELESLRVLMSDFSKYNHGSDYLKQTVNDIRKILNEAEDAVDTYILHVSVQKSRNWVSKFFHQITDYPKVLLDLGKQIEEITAKVNKMNEGKVKHGFDALQHQEVVRLGQAGQPTESPKVEEENVIGFDGASRAVQALLTTGSENLEIISIVGMLGLGKTTLARKVFKEPNVDYEYMVRAFVYVSKDYDKKEVLLRILNSFSKPSEEVNGMDKDRLEKYLYKQLEGKQYLVVMDDVWDPEDWDNFKDCFPKNSKRCRVLLTTRNEKVAMQANTNPNSLYKLAFLNMSECQDLLRWRVFKKYYCPEELKEYEIKIAHKCDGLPLAVVVIAGILVNHPERVDWWMKVAESVENYIARDTEKAGKVIDVMYTHLPNHLKSCFLYLGVFREDFEIPVWKLIRLWISEGLIPDDGGFGLEDTAEVYLDELVYRNLVMVGQRRSNDKIKTCRMHDTLREFCKKEAGEENFFQEIRKDNLPYFLSGNLNLDENRRLCINNASIMEYVSGTPTGKCVRSFLTFVKEETRVEAKHVSSIPKTFKLLRVLEIQSLIFSRFPVELCNLVLLKYIAISSNFSTLPPALSTLYNLQTLIVNTTSPSLEIKVDVWKLPHFRHLHTDAAATLPSPVAKTKDGVWLSKNVQTLCTISTESCKKQVFDRTPQLKKLGICGDVTKLLEVNDGSSSMFSHLRKLSSLENLKLLNGDIDNKLYCLPQKSSFPPKLMKLTLKNTLLEWKEMSVLGQLDHLEVLKLKEYAFQGDWWNTDKGGFRRLRHLYIGQTDLTAWEASFDHFPKLKSLVLNSCTKLQAIPHGLAEIPSLQLVALHCTNPKVASSARRLQVLKLEQANQSNKPSNFKLSVYPPDH